MERSLSNVHDRYCWYLREWLPECLNRNKIVGVFREYATNDQTHTSITREETIFCTPILYCVISIYL